MSPWVAGTCHVKSAFHAVHLRFASTYNIHDFSFYHNTKSARFFFAPDASQKVLAARLCTIEQGKRTSVCIKISCRKKISSNLYEGMTKLLQQFLSLYIKNVEKNIFGTERIFQGIFCNVLLPPSINIVCQQLNCPVNSQLTAVYGNIVIS